jgi:hypothetical protein
MGQADAVASRDLDLQPSSVCCCHVDLDSIGTMWGLLAGKPWQNETFHFLHPMDILIKTLFKSQTGKINVNNISNAIEVV